MYLTLDPNKTNNFWEKFQHSIEANKYSYLIVNGKKNRETNTMNINLDVANEITARMKEADYVRLGASRLIPMPTHFAIKFYENNKGMLSELITIDDSFQEIWNAINLIIQISFYENPNLMELIIPMIVDGINEPDVKIITDPVKQNMIIKRKI